MSTSISVAKSDNGNTVVSALKVAVKIIEYGGSTAFADTAFHRIIRKCDVTNVSIMWRLDNIVVSYLCEGENLTIMKPVEEIGTNLTGVSNLIKLSENVEHGKTGIADIETELERINKLPPIHSILVQILVAGFAAAFWVKFHNESILTMLIVFIAAISGQTLRMKLKAKKVKDQYVTLFCGLISAGITSIALHNGYGDIKIETMISCLIYLVPGLLMINAFVDMTEQKFIFIGSQRILNAAFIFMVLIFVIVTAYTYLKI